MSQVKIGPVTPHFARLVSGRQAEALGDYQLLQWFARDRDQLAFTIIVERYGRLVLSVCRRLLRHVQDSEDAFQATFLVLARKAGSIRKQQSLASWLHGVAYRMSIKANRDAARRRAHEASVAARFEPDSAGDLTWREAQAALDDEIQRLPEKYRVPFMLCCLEGQSRPSVAQRLGIKEGTLSSRLASARGRLQKRLALRGVTLSAALAACALGTANVSASLVDSTVKAAAYFAAGHAADCSLPVAVLAMARGALKMMAVNKLHVGFSLAVAVGLITVGAGSALRQGFGGAVQAAATVETADEDPPASAPAGGIFNDITADSGVDFTYRNGEEAGHCSVLESLGGGVGVIDYDGDGLPDLFFPGGGFFAGPDKKVIRGHPCKLFKNLGHGKFKDVTREVGLDRPAFYSHGVAVLDYDRDGWPDLLVTGWKRLALYHNESDGKGGRHFVDVTQRAGLPLGLWTTSAACADLDGDGFPDLFLCQYVDWSFDNDPNCNGTNPPGAARRDICPPKAFRGLPPKIYRNNGDGTFTDVSREAGLNAVGPDECKSRGVVIADLDADGRADIFVANDTVDNRLYHNQSTRGKIRLAEVGLQAGVARDDRGVPNGSTGVALGDFNGSGRPSLFVTNYEHEMAALYENVSRSGMLLFRFASPRAGLAAIGQTRVGWGTAFLDFDGDGDLDLFIANGHVLKNPPAPSKRKQRPALLRNRGGRFIDVTSQGGNYFLSDHNARGVAVVDLDNDGRLCLIISHLNEPVVILLNQTSPKDHHWIGFDLIGKSRRDVVGARIVVQTDSRTLTSFASAGGSYASSSDRRHLFALGKDEKIKRVSVVWPGGQMQQWDGLAVDRYWRLTENEGASELRRP